MADNIAVSEGSGKTIRSDDVSGVQYQVVKIDGGGDGLTVPLLIDATYGVPSDVKRVTGNVTVVQGTATNLKVDASGVAVPITDNSGSLTVDAPVGTPVFVRLSDGSSAIATLPVQGTVTSGQGTAASNSGAWPIKISDATDTVGISTVSTAKALKVDVIQTVGAGAIADLTTLGSVQAISGLYNESATDPSSGQAAAIRITQERAMHMSIRKADGSELGISTAPVRTDPTGTTKQPANLFDATGTAFSETNPLPISVSIRARTRITKTATFSASQTGTTLWTPGSGKKIYVTKVILAMTVAGPLTIFSQTNAEAGLLLDGTQATGNREYDFGAFPWPTTTADDIIKWTTGSGTVGVITIHGYEE